LPRTASIIIPELVQVNHSASVMAIFSWSSSLHYRAGRHTLQGTVLILVGKGRKHLDEAAAVE
jgi:hypothetical protein